MSAGPTTLTFSAAPEDVPTIEVPVQAPAEAAEEGPQKRATTRAGRAAQTATNQAEKAKEKERQSPPKGPTLPKKKGDVRGSVNGLHSMLGGMAMPFMGMPVTGQAVVQSGPDAGEVWEALAARYPAINKFFTVSGEGQLFVKLLMAYAPVIMVGMAERKHGSAAAAEALASANSGDIMGLLGLVTSVPVPQAA